MNDRPVSHRPIWLASRSPRRAQILEQLNIPFEIVPVEVDEDAILDLTDGPASGKAEHVAMAKARAVQTEDDVFILAADTIVVVDEILLGKPKSRDHARDMMRLISGREHEVITGICRRQPALNTIRTAAVRTTVVVDDLSEAEIEAYLASEEGTDAAGGYKVQGAFARHIRRINGDFCNVMGLPANFVYRWWREYCEQNLS